jgi:hypothetical protein
MRSIYERKAQKELEAEGYKVDWKTRPFRVPKGYQVDFLGVFDLLAVKRGTPIRWISIKGKAGIPSWHRKEVEEMWLPPETNIKEIWYWKGKSGWTKQLIK